MSFRSPSLHLAIALLSCIAIARADDPLQIDHFEFMRHRTTVIAQNHPLTVVLSGLPAPPAAPSDAPAIHPDEVKVTLDGRDAAATLDGDSVVVTIPMGQHLGHMKVRV